MNFFFNPNKNSFFIPINKIIMKPLFQIFILVLSILFFTNSHQPYRPQPMTKKCPEGLYPNGDNCYPCLGCHPCPGPNGTTEYCSNFNALEPADVAPDAFLAGYVFSGGKMVLKNQLAVKKGGTFLFQMVATNSKTGEKIIPQFMAGVKLEVIRKNLIISTGIIDQLGRVSLIVGPQNSDAIRISGIKQSCIKIASASVKLPQKNALTDLMHNFNLKDLQLETIAFTPEGGIAADFTAFTPSILSVVTMPSPAERSATCNPDAVACNCGTNICGKDADACCRICDYLKDGTYSDGCKHAVKKDKAETHSTQ
jgi:hypothetical protein